MWERIVASFFFFEVPEEKCSHCNFPMCSAKCGQEHIKMPECAILAKHLTTTEDNKIDFQAILPLRCLLEKNSTKWNYMQMFEDHCKVSHERGGFFLL